MDMGEIRYLQVEVEEQFSGGVVWHMPGDYRDGGRYHAKTKDIKTPEEIGKEAVEEYRRSLQHFEKLRIEMRIMACGKRNLREVFETNPLEFVEQMKNFNAKLPRIGEVWENTCGNLITVAAVHRNEVHVFKTFDEETGVYVGVLDVQDIMEKCHKTGMFVNSMNEGMQKVIQEMRTNKKIWERAKEDED